MLRATWILRWKAPWILTDWRSTWMSGTKILEGLLKIKLLLSIISFRKLKDKCSFFSEGYTISDINMRFMDTYVKHIWRNCNFYKGEKFSAHLDIFLVSLKCFSHYSTIWIYACNTKEYHFGNKQEQMFYPRIEM